MTFRCHECGKTIHKVADIRNCARCGIPSGKSVPIPAHHDDEDSLTPAILGWMLGSTFSSHSESSTTETFTGGGGQFSGGGASGSFDSPPSPSSDMGPSSDSGGGGGGDGGGGGGGGGGDS